LLRRLHFGIKILYLDFSSSDLFFPTADATKEGLLSILERNQIFKSYKKLPLRGYGASIYVRGYRYPPDKPGILLWKYDYDEGRFRVVDKYFVDTERALSEEEMRDESFEKLIQRSKRIPLEEIASLNSHHDHLNNPSCQVKSKISEVEKYGKVVEEGEVKTILLPLHQIQKIWRNEEIRSTRCETRDFVGLCHLLKYGYEKVRYIKAYLEEHRIGTLVMEHHWLKFKIKCE
jgi:hypothetical protein